MKQPATPACRPPRVLLAVLTLLTLAALPSQGETARRAEAPTPYSLPHTEVRTLPRPGADFPQVLYISLPRDYHQSQARYPVVYLLDPDYAFAIAHNVVEHFVDRQNLPPMIVVGIGYPGHSQDQERYRRHRTRDYTPTFAPEGGYSREIQKLSGGGSAFRDFLAGAVIPFIDRQYRTQPDRTLVGHSFGGLFSTFVLLTKPELFQRYLVVSPSYWYDDGVIFHLEEKLAAGRKDLPARVILLVGEHENQPQRHRAMVDDLERLAAKLGQRDYPNLTIETHVFPGETHNSVFPGAFTRGIRWLFPSAP